MTEEVLDQFLINAVKSKFEQKKFKNPKYSLRNYARYLNLSPASVSLIMNSKKTISIDIFKKIMTKIDLGSANADEVQNVLKKKKKLNRKESLHNKSLDILAEHEYQLISEWYYFAILELIKTKDFKKNVDWIANRLSLDPQTISEALEVLIKLNILTETESGYVDRSEFRSLLDENLSTEGRRKRQKQILSSSIKSIDNIDYSQRDHSAMTMAIDPNLIPEVKKKIALFRRELANFISKKSEKNRSEVYEMQISFFPLTQLRDKHKK